MSDESLVGRVSGLEDDVKDLTGKFSGLQSDVRNMNRTLQDMSVSFGDLSKSVSSANKTDWQSLIASGGLIISIITILGYLTIQPMVVALKETRDWNRRLSERQMAHTKAHGHQGAMVEMEALRRDYEEQKEALKQQDIYLQREMRDLDKGNKGEVDARLAGMDTVLQREMRLLNSAITERLKALSKEVDGIKAEQLRRTDRVYKKKR